MPKIYTLGFQKKSLQEFINLLRGAGVDRVVDIRLRNTSQLAGYTKRDDLSFLLEQGFGIHYTHQLDLAPTAEIMDNYKKDGDWDAYQRDFNALMVERQVQAIGRELVDQNRAICLLCAEPAPERCHRRLLAEYLAAHIPDLEIKHL
ncbi:MAG: DUF488 domain-containing protein [Anaerolineales bacterium]|nr:DUF488 domain-containing protein [Anaerolineales bacterium]